MAYRKACSISIGGVLDQGGGVWRCNVTHFFPPTLPGYDINTFTTGDVLFEEYAATHIRRWKVTGVGAQASPIKQYDVQWDDEGVDPGTGPTSGVNGIISQIVGSNELANQPTREYHQVPDHLRTQIVNDNSILRLADISGGGGTYTNASPTPSTLGGIESGSTFSAQTMQQMWDALLYPYQYPAFTSFVMSGQATTLEVGDSTLVDPTFTWATSNASNVSPNTLRITDVTGGSTILADNLANDGTEAVTLAAISKNSAASHVFRIRGTNTHTDFFTRDFTVSWLWRRFYGEDTDAGPLAESDIEGLRVSALASGFAGTYSFAAGGYKYIAYPTAFGTATTFKDGSTNLDVPFETPYTVSVTNSFSETTDYRVHRSTNILGASINIIVS